MTATLNPGAESIRLDRRYMPLLLQIKTAGAVGVDQGTTAALEQLEAADVLRKGALHPMADAIFDFVADPGLVVSVERLRAGAVAASTIWANLNGATIGTRVDGGIFELRLATTALLPFHLFQLIHLRPLPRPTPFEFAIPADAMFAAEAAICDMDRDGAMAALAAGGVDRPAAAADLLAARVASWRIQSIWSGPDCSRVAAAHGMDCGRHGNVLVTITGETPVLELRSATFGAVTAAVRHTLPAGDDVASS